MSWPMPWPTNFSITYIPWLLTYRSMSEATSDQSRQRPMARMDRSRVSDVTSRSFWNSGRMVPIGKVMAASPHQPLSLQPVSIETMSPSPGPAVGDAVDDLLVDAGTDDGGERRASP